MTAVTASRRDINLLAFLSERARSASVTRLAVDTTLGTLLILPAVLYKPAAWLVIASAGLFLLSYGEWGLLDRMRHSNGSPTNRWLVGVLDVLCALMAAIGITAIAGSLLAIWALALGTWIS
jgi:hypothetical protein